MFHSVKIDEKKLLMPMFNQFQLVKRIPSVYQIMSNIDKEISSQI